MENSMEIPHKIKNRATIWSSYFHFWVFIFRTENTNSKRYMHSYVHHSITYNNQDMETT